jgi:3-methyl-2-oxobutanoate hydroxymethyltransferase
MNKRLTVKDLQDLKGKKQLVLITVKNAEEAMAAEKVGIEMIGTGSPGKYKNPDNHQNFNELIKIREAAPSAFMHYGASDTLYSNAYEACKLALKVLEYGFDMFYCHRSINIIKSLYKEGIPVIGHVGLIPGRTTWTGGYKAVGITAKEATMLYNKCLELEDAGVAAIEMECVPHEVASAIAKRVKPTVLSLGSGSGCDAQYLFACDILGTTTGHVPRHAKSYRNFSQEFKRLQEERVDAFQEFYNDVQEWIFPDDKNIVVIDEKVLDTFLNNLEKKGSR